MNSGREVRELLRNNRPDARKKRTQNAASPPLSPYPFNDTSDSQLAPKVPLSLAQASTLRPSAAVRQAFYRQVVPCRASIDTKPQPGSSPIPPPRIHADPNSTLSVHPHWPDSRLMWTGSHVCIELTGIAPSTWNRTPS